MGSDQIFAEWLRETEDQLYGVTRGHEAADYLEKLEADLEVATMKRVRDSDRIQKMEAALRVYADEDHWFGDKFEPIMFPEGECVCCYEHFSDQGEIARKALEGEDD